MSKSSPNGLVAVTPKKPVGFAWPKPEWKKV